MGGHAFASRNKPVRIAGDGKFSSLFPKRCRGFEPHHMLLLHTSLLFWPMCKVMFVVLFDALILPFQLAFKNLACRLQAVKQFQTRPVDEAMLAILQSLACCTSICNGSSSFRVFLQTCFPLCTYTLQCLRNDKQDNFDEFWFWWTTILFGLALVHKGICAADAVFSSRRVLSLQLFSQEVANLPSG